MKMEEYHTNPTWIVEPTIRGAARHVLFIISDIRRRESPLMSSSGRTSAGFGDESGGSCLSGHILGWSEGHQHWSLHWCSTHLYSA